MKKVLFLLVLLISVSMISIGLITCDGTGEETVATPTASPAGGTFTAAQSVTLSTSTADAKIYYTTDGKAPTTSSTQYSSAISVGQSLTIKAIAVKDGMKNSSVFSANYIINLPSGTVVQPAATPPAGTYTAAQSVVLSTTTDSASIYYTTNGNAPTTSSTLYSAAINISETTTLKAIAVKSGMNNSSVLEAVYTLNVPVAKPIANPAGGSFTTAQNVTLTSATSGASIYYTLNGSDPTKSSTLYSTAISISTTTTLKAIAVKEDMTSDMMTESYFFQGGAQTPAVNSIVGLVQSETVTSAGSFTYADILALTREAIRLAGGLEDIVKSGNSVVLKPNVVGAYYSWGAGPNSPFPELVNGVTTDRRVIQAVAEIVREIVGPYNSTTGAGKIWLIEGPGTGDTNNHFTATGYILSNNPANINIPNVNEVLGLDKEGTWAGAGVGTGTQASYVTQISLPEFEYKSADSGSYTGASPYTSYYKNDGKYWVNNKMLNADVLICIPVLKTHNAAAGMTGSIKNIGIGAAPPKVYGISTNSVGRNGMVNHNSMNIHRWIADYYSCLPADFTVMDGLQGLANGPGGQSSLTNLQADQQNFRLIMASKDALALDVTEANITNWDIQGTWDGTSADKTYITYLTDKGQVYARGEIGKTSPRMIPHRGNPKDILVLGNKKVDDIRKTVAGSTNNGGRQLTAANLTKPTVTINSASFSNGNLNLALTLSDTTNNRAVAGATGIGGTNNAVVKVDIYIDGAFFASVNTSLNSISLDATSIASGARSIEVRGYTSYMSCTTATTTVTK